MIEVIDPPLLEEHIYTAAVCPLNYLTDGGEKLKPSWG